MYVVVISEPRSFEDPRIDPVVGPFATEEEAREYGFMYADGFHVKELQCPPAPWVNAIRKKFVEEFMSHPTGRMLDMQVMSILRNIGL